MMPFNYVSFSKTVGIVAVLSVVGNICLMLIGRALSTEPAGFGPYQCTSIIALTLVGVVGAGAVYAAMRTWYGDTGKVHRHFTILSVVLLVLSFYPDLAMPWSTDADQAGWTYIGMADLMLMHVLAAGLVVYCFVYRKRA